MYSVMFLSGQHLLWCSIDEAATPSYRLPFTRPGSVVAATDGLWTYGMVAVTGEGRRFLELSRKECEVSPLLASLM